MASLRKVVVVPELERYCGQCGAKARSGIGFCESCGRPLGQAPEPARDWSPPQAPSEAPVQSPLSLVEWTSSFPLATSRFMLWDTLKVLTWSGLILYVILAGIGIFTSNADASFLGTAALMVGAAVAGLGFLFFAVMLLYFGNRFTARFAVFREGVAYQSVSRRARLSNRAAVVVGVLAGSPQALGAGLLAASRESGYYSWADLRSVKEYPAHRVLSLCNSWRCVLRLYCSPENYAAVRDLVRAHLPAGAVWREGASRAAPLQPQRVPGSGRGQEGTPAVIELLRRLALAAGVAAFLWLLLDTRSLLYSVSAADFEKEYARKYGKPSGPLLPGVMELGQQLIRETTDPGSAAAFRDQELEGRLLKTSTDGAPWLKAVEANGTLWVADDDPALAPLVPELDRAYQGAHWRNAYLPVRTSQGTRYLEFLRHEEPKDTKAPAGLIHPHRSLAWPWLGVALLVYLFLPGAAVRPGEARRDPLATGVLDFAAVAFAGVFFALPFVFHSSTRAMLDDLAGATGLSWAVAAAIASLLLYNSSMAAFRFSRGPGEVRLRGLWGERIVPFTEIQAVEPLTHGDERTGVILRLRDGSRERIDWTGLLHAETVLSILEPMR